MMPSTCPHTKHMTWRASPKAAASRETLQTRLQHGLDHIIRDLTVVGRARASPEMKLLSSLHARKTNAGPYSLGMAARLTGVCEPNFSTFSSGKLSTIRGVLRAPRVQGQGP